MKALPLGLFAVLLAALSPTAAAGNAYTQGEVHLRAGPSTDYPIAASIPPGSPPVPRPRPMRPRPPHGPRRP